MTCEKCDGTGWIVIETATTSAVKPCSCRAPAKPKKPEKVTPLTVAEAAAHVRTLCDTLAFAPGTAGQSIITAALMKMCETAEQAAWLIPRACELHTEWKTCGIAGLRQILGTKYKPKDGVMVTSTEAYPEGIPSTRPDPEPLLLGLPPGRLVSGDLEMDESIQRLAQVKSIDRPPIINPDYKPITQSDIDRAREEHLLKKAREERGDEPTQAP